MLIIRSGFILKGGDMGIVKYARYVIVNIEAGSVIWYECQSTAEKAQKENGGTLLDTESTSETELSCLIREAHKNMGVE